MSGDAVKQIGLMLTFVFPHEEKLASDSRIGYNRTHVEEKD
jgi:hypothetical protein